MFASPLTLAGAIGVALTLGALVAVPSRYIRSRLRFSLWLLIAAAGLQFAVARGVGDAATLSAIARLVFVLALLNLAISLLVNPWRGDRPSDRYPAIVQDVTLIALFAVVAVVLNEELLTTSAVGAVVVGFALQDTLGNFFAGLAIQIEKPFRVGHWIAIAGSEGQVQEITWRATKLRTKAGQFLIVPNGVMSKEAILNYSEPTIPTRLEVEVDASYDAPPNRVKAALREALTNSPLALSTPPPAVLLHQFAASGITYRVQFWVGDYAVDNTARDQVRSNIWYAFRRADIEIPYPIQIQYDRDEQPRRTEADVITGAEHLGKIDLFSPLSQEARLALSRAGQEHLFGAGEAVVRQGDAGSSMFVILAGRVRIVIEPSGQEVATIDEGGFLGEMSMLTGDPRTATARAVGDVRVLEIPAERFRLIALEHPGLIDHISRTVAARRSALDSARAAATAATQPAAAPRSLLSRIQQFLRLP
jgi:small-conductance mechanosensitive channel/CRP-like cAMP-binding protein